MTSASMVFGSLAKISSNVFTSDLLLFVNPYFSEEYLALSFDKNRHHCLVQLALEWILLRTLAFRLFCMQKALVMFILYAFLKAFPKNCYIACFLSARESGKV